MLWKTRKALSAFSFVLEMLLYDVTVAYFGNLTCSKRGTTDNYLYKVPCCLTNLIEIAGLELYLIKVTSFINSAMISLAMKSSDIYSRDYPKYIYFITLANQSNSY